MSAETEYQRTYQQIKTKLLNSVKPNVIEESKKLIASIVNDNAIEEIESIYNTQTPICILKNVVDVSEKRSIVVNMFSIPFYTKNVSLMKYIEYGVLSDFCIWWETRRSSFGTIETQNHPDVERFERFINGCLFFDCFPYLKKIFWDVLPRLETMVNQTENIYPFITPPYRNITTYASNNPVVFFLAHYFIWCLLTKRNPDSMSIFDPPSGRRNTIKNPEVLYKNVQKEMLEYLTDEASKRDDMQPLFLTGPWHISPIRCRFREAYEFLKVYLPFLKAEHFKTFTGKDERIRINQYIEIIQYMTFNSEFNFPLFLEYIYIMSTSTEKFGDGGVIGTIANERNNLIKNETQRNVYDLIFKTMEKIAKDQIPDPLILLRFYEMIITNIMPNLKILKIVDVVGNINDELYAWIRNIVTLYDIMNLPFWEVNDNESIADYRKTGIYSVGRWLYNRPISQLHATIKQLWYKSEPRYDGLRNRIVYAFYTRNILEGEFNDDARKLNPNITETELFRQRFHHFHPNVVFDDRLLSAIISNLRGLLYTEKQISNVIYPPPFIITTSMSDRLYAFDTKTVMPRILQDEYVIALLNEKKKELEEHEDGEIRFQNRLEFFKNLIEYL